MVGLGVEVTDSDGLSPRNVELQESAGGAIAQSSIENFNNRECESLFWGCVLRLPSVCGNLDVVVVEVAVSDGLSPLKMELKKLTGSTVAEFNEIMAES